jgi:glycosyltransferase involved in cell wall biosynthesis
MNTSEYVLLTAAYNEEGFIGSTIQSIVEQTHVPRQWVIVSDASTDRTDEIIRDYAATYKFIRFHRMCDPHKRNFAAKVNAINAGYALIKSLDFGFIGNVDADITFEADYYERLIDKFKNDDRLGLAGGFIHERSKGEFVARRHNSLSSVPHAVQMLRRQCFDSIGGYCPLPYGGEDWLAEILARKKGWTVASFPDLPVRHYRTTATAEGTLRGTYRLGKLDYSLGSDPTFEVLKCAARLNGRPYLFGAITRLAGFVRLWISREPLSVSEDVAKFIRAEQRARVRAALKLGIK